MRITHNERTETISERGFSLIDVLIGMAIFSVGILGIISSTSSINHYQEHSKKLTTATLYSSNKLEEIKRIATNEPTGGAFGFEYLVGDYLTDSGMTEVNNTSYTLTETVGGMTRTATLSVFPSNPNDGSTFDAPEQIRMVQVVVDTQWTDKKNLTQNMELAAVLHRRQFIQ